MPHAKAMAKIHVDISWSAAASTALAAATGASWGQIVIRGRIRVLFSHICLKVFREIGRSAFERRHVISPGFLALKIFRGFEGKEKASHSQPLE